MRLMLFVWMLLSALASSDACVSWECEVSVRLCGCVSYSCMLTRNKEESVIS